MSDRFRRGPKSPLDDLRARLNATIGLPAETPEAAVGNRVLLSLDDQERGLLRTLVRQQLDRLGYGVAYHLNPDGTVPRDWDLRLVHVHAMYERLCALRLPSEVAHG